RPGDAIATDRCRQRAAVPVCFAPFREEGGDMTTRQRWIAGFGALWLIGSACAGEHVWSFEEFAARAGGGPCGEVYLEGVADSFRLDADLSTPGSSPEIVFEMFIPGSDDVILLTRRIEITLPAEFGFLGFDAPGGVG